MRGQEMIRAMYLGAVCFCIAVVAASCSNNEENDNNTCEKSTNIVVAVEVFEKQHGQTRTERLESKCRHLVAKTYLEPGEKSMHEVILDVCKEIGELPKEQALPLFDKWIDMAIDQPVTNVSHSERVRLFEQLFDIVFFAINSSRDMRTDPLDNWDILFRFYAKCTDEITAVEYRLKSQGAHQHGSLYTYLRSLKVCFKNWVYRMEVVFFNMYSKGLTDEQKADIRRRFDGLKKYMDTPPKFPGG